MGGTRGGPCRRRRGRRRPEAAERPSWEGSEREQRRFAPQDLWGWDRGPGHRFDLGVGACLIGVDFQEYVAGAQGRALVMGDDNFDFFHAGDCRGGDHQCRRVLGVSGDRPGFAEGGAKDGLQWASPSIQVVASSVPDRVSWPPVGIRNRPSLGNFRWPLTVDECQHFGEFDRVAGGDAEVEALGCAHW